MKRNFLILSSCLAILFSCDPDRRTAQGDNKMEGLDEPVPTEGMEYDPASDIDIADENTNVAEAKEQTVEFIKKAAKRSMVEVELARMAQDKAQTAEVKEFAQMVVNEHKMANEKLQKIVQRNDFTLPETMEDVYQDKVEELRGLEGKEFDKQYIDLIKDMHQESIDMYEDEEGEIYDDALRQWVSENLPVLRKHYQRANQIDQML